MIPVITISREFGSEGENVAEMVAETLGYHFVGKDLISDILIQYGFVEFDREYENEPSFWELFDSQRIIRRDESVEMFNKVVRAIAHHGNVVILGRSGFEVLVSYDDVLRVRLQASINSRVNDIMLQKRLTYEQAEEIVKESDKVRMAYVKEFYRVPWEAIHAFDLVVNTSKISPELATAWVVNSAKAYVTRSDTSSQITNSIEVDHILEKAVSEALNCESVHRNP